MEVKVTGLEGDEKEFWLPLKISSTLPVKISKKTYYWLSFLLCVEDIGGCMTKLFEFVHTSSRIEKTP